MKKYNLPTSVRHLYLEMKIYAELTQNRSVRL
nr:MAG TPA: hypothetical protein [Caudoviricetes sp.]